VNTATTTANVVPTTPQVGSTEATTTNVLTPRTVSVNATILVSGSTTFVPSCTTPIEMTRSNFSYFSSIIVDGVSYLKPPCPTSFVMKKPTMKIQFGSFHPSTITSVSVLNPNKSQITSMIVETDYDVYNSTNLDGLQVNFQPNVDFNTHIIITLITTMANPIFPKTIQLAIYGCGQPSSAVTKAQIESTITATLSPAVTSSILVPKTSGIVSQSTSGIIETVTPITPTTPIRTANVNTVTTTVNVVPTTAEIVNTGTKTTPMKTGSSAATGTTGPTTAARLTPTTVCKEIVDFTPLGSVLFASVSLNNLKFPTDGLEKKLSLSTLPTTVSIIFKHGVIIHNVSVLNPSESRVISISAQTDLDFEPINNPNPAIPVVVYNPHEEDVRELDITILKIKDPSLPTKLQLAIYGCTTPSTISTKPLIETTSPQLVSTTQPSTRSGTTRNGCTEIQLVDEAVSKNIIVTPNPLPIGENIKFQPTSQQGVSFGENDRTPTITVNFGKPAEVQSVTLPRDRTPNGNVAQFEVTFYSPHGHKINHKPILSSSSPNENKKKPAELDSSQIPSNTRVSRVVITIVSTTNGESPKGVVLDIQACTEATTETTNVTPVSTGFTSGSRGTGTGTGTGTSTRVGITESTQTPGTTTKRCKEMQAVDEAVSKNIIVTPNPLPIG
ncbi:unnamed protein product, partial [Rotaria socialis]